MAMLEFVPERVPMYKLILHVAQMAFVFVIWCLEIAVFSGQDAVINGNNAWPFALCFLSVPAWIYLCMAPRWPRTRKFAEPRAMAVVDGVFAIFWLSAFSSQAAYNSAGSCGQVCNVSKAIVGLGVFVTLFFIASTVVSVYTVKYWQWNNGRLPGYPENDNKKTRLAGSDVDPHKGDFSTDMHDVEGQYAAVNREDRDEDHTTSYGGAGGYTSVNSRYGNTEVEGYGRSEVSYNDGGRTDVSYNDGGRTDTYSGTDTEYRSHTAAASSVGGRPYNPPSAVDEYDDDRPARFPAGNYSR